METAPTLDPNDNEEQRIARVFDGKFALGLTRALIWVGMPVLIGCTSYFGNRFVTAFDTINLRLDRGDLLAKDLSSQIQLLQQAMQFRAAQRDAQMQDIQFQIKDHEIRLRGVERRVPLSKPDDQR